jgi:hypothetical protein
VALLGGRRLGPYEILSPLGAGGMGEVYVARDERLDRRVAIKVLAADIATDPAHLIRFQREAKAASALNHPNIVAVYDIGESDSVRYVAMELLEGKTLAEVLVAGPLPARKLLDIAGQIADGLAAAHEAGIVHRDLKPANVMVTREGFAKILDFGLARASSPAGEQSNVETETPAPTLSGQIVGTVGYMSPEQARGEPVDFRSDQFSLGSMLYEMATGKRAFRGKTRIDTLAAVLNEEPEPIARLRPGVPPPLRWAIERCLAKAAGDRYQSTRDLARELRGIREHLSEVSGAVAPAEHVSPRRRLRLLAAATAVIAAGAGLWALFGGLRAARTEPDFRRLTFRSGAVSRALFVPQSSSILYTASWDGQPVRSYLTLPASKGVDRGLEGEPQVPLGFTEDGSEVLVLLGGSRPAINLVGTLAWWPVLGGKARPILENAGWADWARRGHFLAVVREEGSERALELWSSDMKKLRELFRTAGAISHVRISPDEREIAFIHHPSRYDDAGEVRRISVDGTRMRVVSPLFERCLGLGWDPRSGKPWFTGSRENIYATSLWSATSSGSPRLVAAFPEFFLLQDVSDAGCLFVASSGGTTLMLRRAGSPPHDFSWLGSTIVADVSPDGRSLLFLDGSASEGTLGTWIRPIDGGEAIRIADGDPGKFSPDGKWVITSSRVTTGAPQLILAPVGRGRTRQLTKPPGVYSSPSFADSGTLLFKRSESGRSEVWRMGTDGKAASSLGAPNCSMPASNPTATSFLCVGEPAGSALYVYPVEKRGEGRKLYALEDSQFVYARWNESGGRIFAVTSDRRLLTLDSSSGALLHQEPVPVREGAGYDSLLAAAMAADGSIQAYSISHFSSRLYLCRGLR